VHPVGCVPLLIIDSARLLELGITQELEPVNVPIAVRSALG